MSGKRAVELLAGAVLIVLCSGPALKAQSTAPPDSLKTPASWRTVTDTSYFRPGEDNWNLVESVLRSDPANVFLLLNRGADPDARAEGGMTALMFAAERGDTLSIQLLVLNGADPDLTYVEETPPLMVAVLAGQFEAAHKLLQYGADPDHRDAFGGTSLIYAAALNNYRMADLLLFFGASDTLRNREGNDALMTATGHKSLATADVLLQNGVGPDTRDKRDNTPLMIAAQQGNTEMIELLLEYDAGLEQVNKRNYTPLAHAVHEGHPDAVRILADSGARVDHTLRKNLNLYDLAVRLNHRKVRDILKERGAEPTPLPDFSEIQIRYGNSFGGGEHMMQARIRWYDTKFGLFAETGYDVRPVLRKVQVPSGDSLIYQYRESRSAWVHGIGKTFTLARDATGIEYGVFASVHGMLSFSRYRGVDERPPVRYGVMPSAGLFLRGTIAGMHAGMERYGFGTLNEGYWKGNITLYLRIPYKPVTYEKKYFGHE